MFQARFVAGKISFSGWLTDVNIRCKDGEVSAHRVILAASSTYFRTMFR